MGGGRAPGGAAPEGVLQVEDVMRRPSGGCAARQQQFERGDRACHEETSVADQAREPDTRGGGKKRRGEERRGEERRGEDVHTRGIRVGPWMTHRRWLHN